MSAAIEVPIPLLLDSNLSPSAKLLWIVFRYSNQKAGRLSHRPKDLVEFTGLSRSTVHRVLKRLAETGWCSQRRAETSAQTRWQAIWPKEDCETIKLPVCVMAHLKEMRPRHVLLYCFLQKVSGPNRIASFKWAQLRKLSKWHLRTLKRAVRALNEYCWVKMQGQLKRTDPLRCRLCDADEGWQWDAQQRLERAEYAGEGLMREWLRLIVRADGIDEASPDFLVNPQTGEKLRFDWFCPDGKVACEFNGPQHYRPTAKFSKEEVAAQRRRDAFKKQACRSRNIRLVVIHAEDLSLQGMLKKVGSLLPLRSLHGFQQTIEFLESRSRRYREAATGR